MKIEYAIVDGYMMAIGMYLTPSEALIVHKGLLKLGFDEETHKADRMVALQMADEMMRRPPDCENGERKESER